MDDGVGCVVGKDAAIRERWRIFALVWGLLKKPPMERLRACGSST